MEQNKLSVMELGAITAEIIMLKQQTASNLIEIGKRLILVKESLAHGEWLPWLENRVEFSDQQARRLMKVAKECSNSTALLNLPPSKVFALLDLPADQREEFVNVPHTLPSGSTKTVDEMTTRELQQAIQAQKAAEKRAKEAEAAQAELEAKAVQAEQRAKDAEQELQKEKARAKSEVDRLTKLLDEAKNDGSTAELVAQLEAKLKEAQQQVQNLTAEMSKPVTLEPVVVEKVPEEIERELAELRKKTAQMEAKAGQQGVVEEAILKYRIHFDELVANFRSLLSDLAAIQEADAGLYDKYRKPITALIAKMSERL